MGIYLCSWDVKSTIYKSLLDSTKNFSKREAVIGKTSFFARALFCNPHSIFLNIGF